MYFGKLRDYSVKIETDKKLGCLPENVGYIPLAVVEMTTAFGMHPAFSKSHPKYFDYFRLFPTSHGLCRSPLDPALS